jgi:flagellar hook-associated protein 3 FlgL
MRVSTNSFTNNFLYQIGNLEDQQTTLQSEVSTGLKLSEPEDDPSAMNQVLNLQTEASSTAQYQSNISQTQTTATTASDALNSLQTLVEQAGEIANEAANSQNSSTQLTTYAATVGNLIQEALGVANIHDSNGNYIFAGTNNSAAPFTATTDSNGNVTSVTYNGNTSVASTEIASGLTVSAQSPGENNSGSGAGGVFADSRAGADVFAHLIALQQDLTAAAANGNTSADVAAITADHQNLTKDEDNVVTQISSNAVLQSTLETASNVAQQQATTFTSQMSNDTNADLAQTVTKLQQTQTAYQASLQSGAMVMQLSLMTFLS